MCLRFRHFPGGIFQKNQFKIAIDQHFLCQAWRCPGGSKKQTNVTILDLFAILINTRFLWLVESCEIFNCQLLRAELPTGDLPMGKQQHALWKALTSTRENCCKFGNLWGSEL
jgi:hypothetical protein